MTSARLQQILAIAREQGLIRAEDVEDRGLQRRDLSRLVEAGQLVRVARGVYALPDAEFSQHHSLAVAAKAVPKGVICLLSALRFHEIGTQLPREVWMALPRPSRIPSLRYPPMRFLTISGAAFADGRERHVLDGIQVWIYSPAKTVADCFRFRNEIGLEAAIEALREAVAQHKATRDQIWQHAKVCRAAEVMRPYLEALA